MDPTHSTSASNAVSSEAATPAGPPGSEHPPPRALFKTILASSGLYMVALMGQRMASMIMVPIVTRYLTPADYGVMELLEQIGSVTSVLLGVNISAAIGYFYFQPGADKSRVVGTVFGGSLLLGFVGAVVGLLLAGPISRSYIMPSPDHWIYLALVFGAMPLSFVVEAGTSWMRTENRTRLFTLVSLLRIAVVIGFTILLVVGMGFRIGGILGANLAGIILAMGIVSVMALRSHAVRFDRALFGQMLWYAVPLAFSSLAQFAVHFGDRFILPYYVSFDEIGLYSLAYKFGMLISFIYSSFSLYWSAQLFQIVQRNDAPRMVGRVFTYMTFVICFSGVTLLAASRPAIQIFAAPAYQSAVALVPVILGAYVTRAVGDFFRPLFLAKGKPTYDAACYWIGAAVCLTCYWLLIPRYGVLGAAASTGISFMVISVIALIVSYRLLPYQLEGGRIARIVVSGILITAAYFFLPETSTTGQILQGLALLLAYAVLLLMSGFLNPGEKDILRSLPVRLRQQASRLRA